MVKYPDDEHEMISISSDAELREAFAIARGIDPAQPVRRQQKKGQQGKQKGKQNGQRKGQRKGEQKKQKRLSLATSHFENNNKWCLERKAFPGVCFVASQWCTVDTLSRL